MSEQERIADRVTMCRNTDTRYPGAIEDIEWLLDRLVAVEGELENALKQLQPLGWETGLPINDFGRRCYAAGKAFNEFTAFHAHNGMMDALAERDAAQAALAAVERERDELKAAYGEMSDMQLRQRQLVITAEAALLTLQRHVRDLAKQLDTRSQLYPAHDNGRRELELCADELAALLPSLAEKDDYCEQGHLRDKGYPCPECAKA